ncbi:PspC domain-containing protein [Bacillus alkalicellulosilyticus]|uniref:PspC domain-containing protein n=1 Tax=Alkalihalobacterium alkalicellulosilyticum TaxID=1912214 RepID=UPI000996696F|nr:PspC domain-containing protein [Bacillus alkalicellulosilyticus]
MKRLFRAQFDRKFAGVCGGLADYLGVDKAMVRILTVVGAIFFFPVVVAYIVAIFIIPNEQDLIE